MQIPVGRPVATRSLPHWPWEESFEIPEGAKIREEVLHLNGIPIRSCYVDGVPVDEICQEYRDVDDNDPYRDLVVI